MNTFTAPRKKPHLTTARAGAFGFIMLLLLLGMSCEMFTGFGSSSSSSKKSAPPTGELAGIARYRGAEQHSGIIISLEQSDGLQASTLGSISSQATTTASDGSFRIEGLAPGFYTVYAVSPYSEEGAVTTTVEVTASETADIGTLRLSPLGDVLGRVLLDGAAPGDTEFEVFIPGTSFGGRTGVDGSFRIRGVPALDEYPLLLSLNGAYIDPGVSVILAPGPNNLEQSIELSSGDINIAVSLVWRGILPQAPANPEHNWAYYDTEQRRIRIFDGGSWYLLGTDGEPYSRWDIDIGVPQALADEYQDASWYLVAHFGDGELSTPEPYQPNQPAAVRVAHRGGGPHDPAELYLFADTTEDGAPRWLQDPVIYLGSYDPSRYQYIDRTLIRLQGNVAALAGSSNPYSPADLLLQVRYTSSDALQWAPLTGPQLEFELYVPADTRISLSARRRSGTPQSFADSAWQATLGYPVQVASAERYFTNQNIYAPPPPGTEILIVWHPDDSQQLRPDSPQYRPLLQMVKNVLEYAGLSYQDVHISQLDRVDLSRFAAVVFTTESLSDLWWGPMVDEFNARVADGMGVVFAKRGYAAGLADLIGVTAYSGFASSVSSNLCFTQDWLPGLNELCIPEDQSGYSRMEFTLADSVMRLTTEPGRTALAWRHSHGDGRVFFWNSDLTEYAQYRGLLLHSILDVLPVGAAHIANAGVFHIDDYPLPVFAGQQSAPTATEYPDKQNYQFYREVWLPDMLELANTFGMQYLFAVPFNYTTNTTPEPGGWSFAQWEGAPETWAPLNGQDVPFGVAEAAKIRQAGHELSLHGYNHRSLLGDSVNSANPNYWIQGGGSSATMRSSVEAARQRWLADNLGPLPVSYVAPNNRIDRTGLAVLRQAFPELRIFAGDITIKFQEGGRIDYGPDPVDPHFFALPRWTSGFYNSSQTKLYAVSQLALSGVWSHFVHPDDIYDIPGGDGGMESGPTRNPGTLPWGGRDSSSGHGLYQELTALLQWNQDNYPWFRWLTTVQAVDRVERAMNTRVHWEHDPLAQRLSATFEGEPQYLWVRLSGPRTLDSAFGATVEWEREHADNSGNGNGYALYLLRARSNIVQVSYTVNE